MPEPRIRTVNKATAPYELNRFPRAFLNILGAEIVYMIATKQSMSLEGDEWEQIFANCISADWRPSNVGLDDVQLDNCCWSAKTVFAQGKDISKQKVVRLISGRNSPAYSYGEDIILNADPNHIGRMVLDIWNERVSGIRQYFKFARTVVLVKSSDYSEFLVFETETIRYDPELYSFRWNSRGNLEGFSKETHEHTFTWQPHGSQFTIIEPIPSDRVHIRLRVPPKLDKQQVLQTLHYDSSWITLMGDRNDD